MTEFSGWIFIVMIYLLCLVMINKTKRLFTAAAAATVVRTKVPGIIRLYCSSTDELALHDEKSGCECIWYAACMGMGPGCVSTTTSNYELRTRTAESSSCCSIISGTTILYRRHSERLLFAAAVAAADSKLFDMIMAVITTGIMMWDTHSSSSLGAPSRLRRRVQQ